RAAAATSGSGSRAASGHTRGSGGGRASTPAAARCASRPVCTHGPGHMWPTCPRAERWFTDPVSASSAHDSPVQTAPERLGGLVDAGIALSSELSLEALLRRFVEIAVSLTAARYGALGVLGPAGTGLEQFVTVGVDEATRAEIGDPPHGRGILGVLIEE